MSSCYVTCSEVWESGTEADKNVTKDFEIFCHYDMKNQWEMYISTICHTKRKP